MNIKKWIISKLNGDVVKTVKLTYNNKPMTVKLVLETDIDGEQDIFAYVNGVELNHNSSLYNYILHEGFMDSLIEKMECV